jgi:hypothetical protein
MKKMKWPFEKMKVLRLLENGSNCYDCDDGNDCDSGSDCDTGDAGDCDDG